jgi:LuxR family glucitol operon transcriptional activator
LGQPGGDIARFCFESTVEHIRNTDADQLLAIIALFATSASREGLSYIGGFDQDVVTRDTALMTLEKLSLVNRMPNGRFGMLPLTKLYVLAASSLDATAISGFRKRQIEYYLKYIQRPQPFALYPKELVDRIKAEQENILDLLEWCKEHNDQFCLLEIFLRIQDLLGVFGRLDLRVAWGEYAIEAAKAVDALAALGRLYAVTMGWAALKRGELDQASSWIDKGLQIFRQSGEQELECVAMRFLGRLRQLEGREEQALQIFLDTLAIAEEKHFQGSIAGLNADIAYWEMQHGSLDTAERYMRESIRGFESLGDYVRASDRVIMLADILIRQGKFSDAEECLLPNLEHVEKELGQLEAIAHGYACLAHIRAHQGDIAEARRCCAYAREVYDKIGMKAESFPIGLPSISEE